MADGCYTSNENLVRLRRMIWNCGLVRTRFAQRLGLEPLLSRSTHKRRQSNESLDHQQLCRA